MVHRQVVSAIALVLVASASTLQPGERALAWADVPEATKARIATLLARMDRCVVPGSPAEWNPSDMPRMSWTRPTDHRIAREVVVRFPRYTVFISADLQSVTSANHADAYYSHDSSAAVVTPEQAYERAVAILRLEGRTEELSLGACVLLGAKYSLTIGVSIDGIPLADLTGSYMMLVDARTGRISLYEPQPAPALVGPRVASITALAAQTEAGLALGSRADGRSWVLREARLKWTSPRWPEALPGRRTDDDELVRRGACRLFYEVFAVATTGVVREDSPGAIVYIDPASGLAAGLVTLGARSASPVPSGDPPMRFRAEFATVAVGERRVAVRDAAILWTKALAPLGEVRVTVASPNAALRLDYDPERGVVVDPRTGRVGIPSRRLAAGLRAVTRAAPGAGTGLRRG
jgi:hypothetical protein